MIIISTLVIAYILVVAISTIKNLTDKDYEPTKIIYSAGDFNNTSDQRANSEEIF